MAAAFALRASTRLSGIEHPRIDIRHFTHQTPS
jgi:hypothetical protein